MLQNRGVTFKVIFLIVIGVVLQTFLQNSTELQHIIKTIAGYLKPFIYGVLIAVVIHPISVLFEKRLNQKRWVSILLAFILSFVILFGLLRVILPGLFNSVGEIIDNSPTYLEKLTLILEDWLHQLDVAGIVTLNMKDSGELFNQYVKIDNATYANLAKSISVSFLGLLTFFGQVGVGGLLALFLVHNREYFSKLVHNLFMIYSSNKRADSVLEFLDQVRKIFLNYMWGKTLSSVALGLIVFILLYFTKVPYAGLISVLIGIGNMIPYVGTLIATLVSVILVVVVNPHKIWFIIGATLIGNQVEGLLISPLLIGKTVGLSAFWVITGVLLGGAIFGPVGMIFGVPAIAVIKHIYKLKLDSVQEEN